MSKVCQFEKSDAFVDIHFENILQRNMLQLANHHKKNTIFKECFILISMTSFRKIKKTEMRN